MTTTELFQQTIDDMSEDVRINGSDARKEFCLNFLAANIDALVELWDEDAEA